MRHTLQQPTSRTERTNLSPALPHLHSSTDVVDFPRKDRDILDRLRYLGMFLMITFQRWWLLNLECTLPSRQYHNGQLVSKREREAGSISSKYSADLVSLWLSSQIHGEKTTAAQCVVFELITNTHTKSGMLFSDLSPTYLIEKFAE